MQVLVIDSFEFLKDTENQNLYSWYKCLTQNKIEREKEFHSVFLKSNNIASSLMTYRKYLITREHDIIYKPDLIKAYNVNLDIFFDLLELMFLEPMSEAYRYNCINILQHKEISIDALYTYHIADPSKRLLRLLNSI